MQNPADNFTIHTPPHLLRGLRQSWEGELQVGKVKLQQGKVYTTELSRALLRVKTEVNVAIYIYQLRNILNRAWHS